FGAFGQKGNADALWARLRTRAEVAGHPRIDLPAGAITRLLAGGYSREGAEKACAALKANGQSCIVVGNWVADCNGRPDCRDRFRARD
ncbi:SPOR domain-containing protein, partial [Escherichia coli]